MDKHQILEQMKEVISQTNNEAVSHLIGQAIDFVKNQY
jgi:hypothetical protein